MKSSAHTNTARTQLERLGTLIDVVHAGGRECRRGPDRPHRRGRLVPGPRKKLVREGLSREDRVGIQIEAFTDPTTALVTLPFAFVGELAWNPAWLSLIPIAAALRRRARKLV
jgi:hypothetical protein